jgi:hypothetical protein
MATLVDDLGCWFGDISCSNVRMGSVQGWIRRKACSQEPLGAHEVWAKGNVKRLRSPCSKQGVPLVELESAAGNKLEKMGFKGDSLSTLVKMGGRSAVGVVHITRFVAPGHEAPFSLAQSVAFAAGTIVHADLSQLPLVGSVEDDRGRLGGALLAFLCQALKLPLSSLRWHRAMSVRIRPWPHASPTSCLAPSLSLSAMKGCFPLSQSWLPLPSYTTAGVE